MWGIGGGPIGLGGGGCIALGGAFWELGLNDGGGPMCGGGYI